MANVQFVISVHLFLCFVFLRLCFKSIVAHHSTNTMHKTHSDICALFSTFLAANCGANYSMSSISCSHVNKFAFFHILESQTCQFSINFIRFFPVHDPPQHQVSSSSWMLNQLFLFLESQTFCFFLHQNKLWVAFAVLTQTKSESILCTQSKMFSSNSRSTNR